MRAAMPPLRSTMKALASGASSAKRAITGAIFAVPRTGCVGSQHLEQSGHVAGGQRGDPPVICMPARGP
jgi:hypothetical protein